jgi:hypothetical protein
MSCLIVLMVVISLISIDKCLNGWSLSMVLNGVDTKFQLELSFNGASSSVMKILKKFPNDGFLCFRGI